MNIRQVFLLITAAGLVPVALSYGLMPRVSMDFLFGISAADVNNAHIFRAVMGLYLGFAVFWVAGAFNEGVREASLYSLVVFMLGVAAGRVLSILVDGMPHWLMVVYLLLELSLGCAGMLLLKKAEQKSIAGQSL
ncbi:hypothetical protein DSLASN_13180 [Desulfoluna limicola]|uniref:DUF4345 domain-containing protein n=1 Tax=Desulfoluna limicola TaxID=2810562 RepID=A0ABM7PF39_9BACT|nr:DUF4345 domain-containing protein [Desulfoluna limicola]BCS95686.1 hypothetical protein DSLASN_13180 [Desulfoluna limicola]